MQAILTTELEHWLDAACLGAQVERTGAIELLHDHLTAALYRFPTDQGWLYLKIPAANFRYEAALTAKLAELAPHNAISLVATEPEAGWLLMRDFGLTLRKQLEADKPNTDWGRWAEMLRQFARLQQAVIPSLPEIAALGVESRRLTELPRQFEALVADREILLVGQPNGISEEVWQTYRAFAPQVSQLCEALAAFEVPETIHHDDFHTNNVASDGDDYLFFDWAESFIAHPFYSLKMSLRYAQFVFDAPNAVLDELRDAYLEQWQDYGSLSQLREAYVTANQLAKLCRALTWAQLLRTIPAEQRGEDADSAVYWLGIFINDTED
jgi:hypothetical protein